MLIHPGLRRQREEDQKFKATLQVQGSLGYERTYVKSKHIKTSAIKTAPES